MILTLNVPVQEINKILVALGRQPYDDVAGLINDLVNQSNSQMAAKKARDEAERGDPPQQDQ